MANNQSAWRSDAIRQALKLTKCKKNPSKLVLELNLRIEINKDDLSKPRDVLFQIEELFQKEMDLLDRTVDAVLESPTKKAWLESKQHKKG